MAIEKLTKDLNIIQKLDDEPNDVGGLTSAQLKAEFDKAGNEIKEYLNNTVVPAINSVQTQANASTADQHTHSNKALLDTYDQTNADIKDAIAKEHTHSNKSVLDTITAGQQTVLASIKGVTQTLGNATDKVPSEAAVSAAMAANGNIPAGGTTGQVLAKASGNALDVTWKSLTYSDVGAAATKHTHVASEVGARPDTWMPSLSELGAAPSGYGYGGAAIDLGVCSTEDAFNTALDTVYNSMGSRETKMITVGGIKGSDWRYFGILTKSSANYGSCVLQSAQNKGVQIQKARYGGVWQPMDEVATTLNFNTIYGGIKPTGTYTGTGKDRTVSIGGIGSLLLVQDASCTFFVTSLGAFEFRNNTASVPVNQQSTEFIYYFRDGVTYSGGVLTLTSGSNINSTGDTYTYQVL